MSRTAILLATILSLACAPAPARAPETCPKVTPRNNQDQNPDLSGVAPIAGVAKMFAACGLEKTSAELLYWETLEENPGPQAYIIFHQRFLTTAAVDQCMREWLIANGAQDPSAGSTSGESGDQGSDSSG